MDRGYYNGDLRRNERGYQQFAPLYNGSGGYYDRDNINQGMNQFVRNSLMNKGVSLIQKTIKNDLNEHLNNQLPEITGGIYSFSNYGERRQASWMNNSNLTANRYNNQLNYGYNPYPSNRNDEPQQANPQLQYYLINGERSVSGGRPKPLSMSMPQSTYSHYYNQPIQIKPYSNMNRHQVYLPPSKPFPRQLIQNPNSNFNFLSKSFQQRPIPRMDDSSMPPNDIENADINISYDNFVLDEEKRHRLKDSYKKDLQTQMQLNEKKKADEKRRKKEEDREEEIRIERENEEILAKLKKEQSESKALVANIDFINQYIVKSKKTNRYNKEIETEEQKERRLKQYEEDKKNQEKVNEMHQKEVESRIKFRDTVNQLREHCQGKNAGLYDNILSLKDETQTASLNRAEAFRQIESMKKGLAKQRIEEGYKKKYVYDVLDEDRLVSYAYKRENLNDNGGSRDKAELNKSHKKQPKPIIEDPTSLEMKGHSLFLSNDHDINTNVIEYKYSDRSLNEKEEAKSPLAIIDSHKRINGSNTNDYQFIMNYFKDHEVTSQKNPWQSKIRHVNPQTSITSKDKDKEDNSHFNANSIFQSNLDRLNNLNKKESKYECRRENTEESKEQFNEFLAKINCV